MTEIVRAKDAVAHYLTDGTIHLERLGDTVSLTGEVFPSTFDGGSFRPSQQYVLFLNRQNSEPFQFVQVNDQGRFELINGRLASAAEGPVANAVRGKDLPLASFSVIGPITRETKEKPPVTINPLVRCKLSRTKMTTTVSAGLVAFLVSIATPAYADNRQWCDKFSDHVVYFWNGGSGSYYPAIQEAIFDLPGSMNNNTVIDFLQVGGYGEQDQVNVHVSNLGDTGWAGLAAPRGVYGNCILTWGDAYINQYYMDAQPYEDKRYVAAHENGHLHGLTHTSDPTSPMNSNLYGAGVFSFNSTEQYHLWNAYCPSCGTVSLRAAANWQFVAAENGGGHILNANRPAIGPWEQFKLHHRGGNWYALQATDGRFVTAIGAGGGAVYADRTMIGPWEEFEAIALGSNAYALRTSSGHYLSGAVSTPMISATATGIGGWEVFYAY